MQASLMFHVLNFLMTPQLRFHTRAEQGLGFVVKSQKMEFKRLTKFEPAKTALGLREVKLTRRSSTFLMIDLFH